MLQKQYQQQPNHPRIRIKRQSQPQSQVQPRQVQVRVQAGIIAAATTSKSTQKGKVNNVDNALTSLYNTIGSGSNVGTKTGGIGTVSILAGVGRGTLGFGGKLPGYYTQEKTTQSNNKTYAEWKIGDKEYKLTSENVHFILDVMGMIPAWGDLADLANAAVYLNEGNIKEAGAIVLSVLTNTDDIKTLNKFRKQLDAACETAENVDKLGNGYKAAKKISKEVKEELKEEAAEKVGKKVVIEGGSKAIDNVIPNVENATINPKKLTEYALNPNHPVGGNKAKVFESALGYNQSNADDLIRQIYEKLPNSEAVLGQLDEYGQRYTVVIPITGSNGNTVNVRTGWIIKTGSDIPELTTLFVKD